MIYDLASKYPFGWVIYDQLDGFFDSSSPKNSVFDLSKVKLLVYNNNIIQ